MFTLFSRTRVLIFFIATALSGFHLLAFQYAGDPALSPIHDADYSLVNATVNGVALTLPGEPPVSISFHSGDVFSGRVGSNRYFGMVELTPEGSLRVEPGSVAATGQTSTPDVMSLQQTFLDALKAAIHVHILSNEIALSSSDGLNLLQFARTPMDKRISAVKNIEFRLVRLVANSQQASISPAKITLTLTENTRFTGFSGVNNYSGQFEVDADGRFRHLGPIVATQRAGSPELMELESTFFSALEKVQRLKLTGNRLVLETDDQDVVLEFTSARNTAQ